jgi:ArsR family transcriptional regulator
MTADRQRLQAQADIFKALAHPTRLLIVEQIAEKERCVCELTEVAGVDTSTVSKHLSVLKNAGVVTDEKRGNMVFYSLAMPCVLSFFSCLKSSIEKRAREQLRFSRAL